MQEDIGDGRNVSGVGKKKGAIDEIISDAKKKNIVETGRDEMVDEKTL